MKKLFLLFTVFFIASLSAQTPDTTRISTAEKKMLIAKIDSLNRLYYFRKDSCENIAGKLYARLIDGAYDTANTSEKFALMLARDLKRASGDFHFHVWYSKANAARSDLKTDFSKNKDLMKSSLFRQQRLNFGLVDIRILEGGIGYVKMDQFANEKASRRTLAAVSDFLAHTDAVILDFRNNEGGSQRTIGRLARYFIGPRQDLLINYRRDKKPIHIRTPRRISGTSLKDKPLVILTSDQTFSAPEAFAYCMQQLKRAKVIGDTTGGGAHPVKTYFITSRFLINIPIGDVRCAIDGKNWENSGVFPDIPADADKAMKPAKLYLLQLMRRSAKNESWSDYYTRLIEDIQK